MMILMDSEEEEEDAPGLWDDHIMGYWEVRIYHILLIHWSLLHMHLSL